ncbi:MAG TPA: site-2 protease family protein [Thermodesulfobacteriota bacterium]|nr:site-2 protease family protein [Thermodesulfobacteriota bacterium]
MWTRVPLFRIFGIQVTANWSWLVILVLITGSLAGGFLPAALPGRPAALYWLLGLASALLFFVSLLAHELAHSLVARRHGLPVREILLFVFGGVSNIEREAHEPRVEFRIAIVGPLTSFAIGGLCWLAARAAGPGAARVVLTYLAAVNLLVGLFNLLPGFPLDGGRVLRAFLWSRWRDLARATRTAATVGTAVGWALILLGALEALRGNFVGGLWTALIGMFLQGAAEASAQQVTLREQLRGVTVAEVMTPDGRVVGVPADLPVDRLVEDFFWRMRFDTFPVQGPGGEFVGVVSLEQVRPVPRSAWGRTRVADIMRPAEAVPVVSPEDDAVRALERMVVSGEGRLPVVRRVPGAAAGRLAGIVTRRDILYLLRLRTDLGEAGAGVPRLGAARPDEPGAGRRAP